MLRCKTINSVLVSVLYLFWLIFNIPRSGVTVFIPDFLLVHKTHQNECIYYCTFCMASGITQLGVHGCSVAFHDMAMTYTMNHRLGSATSIFLHCPGHYQFHFHHCLNLFALFSFNFIVSILLKK